MKTSLTLTALALAVAGCASLPMPEADDVPRPKNGTLRTDGGPLVQAHRGSRCEYQDNAAGGFGWCLARGVRGYETDIRFSKDRRLVVMHDDHANRTSDGKGLVEDLTREELGKMRLRNCSEPVPTVEQLFDEFKGRDDFFIELEMKAYPSKFYTPEVLEDYCRQLNALARKMLPEGTYAFTCFNTNTLATMRRVDPDAPLGLIMWKPEEWHFAAAKALKCCSIAPGLPATDRATVDRAHAEGLLVCLWMVQDTWAFAEAKAKGADRVTSDYPVLLQRAVEGRRKKLVALDLDAKFLAGDKPLPPGTLQALRELQRRYRVALVGDGDATRVTKQLADFTVDVVGVAASAKDEPKRKTPDKFSATLAWAVKNGCEPDDVVFIGDDYADGGGAACVRVNGLDHVIVNDGRTLADAVSVLVK